MVVVVAVVLTAASVVLGIAESTQQTREESEKLGDIRTDSDALRNSSNYDPTIFQP